MVVKYKHAAIAISRTVHNGGVFITIKSPYNEASMFLSRHDVIKLADELKNIVE